MTRPRAVTSTARSVIALLTALVVSVVGATALPAAALAGHGQAKGHQVHKPNHGNSDHRKVNNGQAHKVAPAKQQGSAAKSDKAAPAQQAKANHGQSSHTSNGPASKSGPSSAGTITGKAGSSGKGDPKGNNGTIKLAGFDAPNGPGHASGDGSTPMHPSNDPHLSCSFAVEGFGFDAVASQSQLTFEQQAPTRGGSKQYDSIPLDGDSASGGGSTAGYDGVTYPELTFVGDPHPKHGYHVKLTAYTDYSQGSNVKHKVFWVEPCETTTAPPGGNTPGGNTPGGNTPGGNTPGGNTPGGNTPGGNTPGGNTPGGNTPGGNTPGGAQQTVEENGGNTSTVVLGAQASVKNSQGAQAAANQAAANQSAGTQAAQAAQVPTAIESGLSGKEWSRSVLPFLLVMLGLGTTFVALVRRRTRVQPVRND